MRQRNRSIHPPRVQRRELALQLQHRDVYKYERARHFPPPLRCTQRHARQVLVQMWLWSAHSRSAAAKAGGPRASAATAHSPENTKQQGSDGARVLQRCVNGRSSVRFAACCQRCCMVLAGTTSLTDARLVLHVALGPLSDASLAVAKLFIALHFYLWKLPDCTRSGGEFERRRAARR